MTTTENIKQRSNGRHKIICLSCAEHFLGRKNSKYCSNQCKNDRNNELFQLNNERVREIDKFFHKNRKIAEEIALLDDPIITHLELLRKGYNLKYYTHKVNVEDNQVQQECEVIYDHVLIQINSTPVSFKIKYTDDY